MSAGGGSSARRSTAPPGTGRRSAGPCRGPRRLKATAPAAFWVSRFSLAERHRADPDADRRQRRERGQVQRAAARPHLVSPLLQQIELLLVHLLREREVVRRARVALAPRQDAGRRDARVLRDGEGAAIDDGVLAAAPGGGARRGRWHDHEADRAVHGVLPPRAATLARPTRTPRTIGGGRRCRCTSTSTASVGTAASGTVTVAPPTRLPSSRVSAGPAPIARASTFAPSSGCWKASSSCSIAARRSEVAARGSARSRARIPRRPRARPRRRAPSSAGSPAPSARTGRSTSPAGSRRARARPAPPRRPTRGPTSRHPLPRGRGRGAGAVRVSSVRSVLAPNSNSAPTAASTITRSDPCRWVVS